MFDHKSDKIYGTTVLCIREQKTSGAYRVVMIADGQVSVGNTILKNTAIKVRRFGANDDILVGFAGATADAMTLREKLEAKLSKHSNNLQRACIELAKDWRGDKITRNLESLMIVANSEHLYMLTGSGDVFEPHGNVVTIGSGGNFALSAARALLGAKKSTNTTKGHSLDIVDVAQRAMGIANELCIYSNNNFTQEEIL